MTTINETCACGATFTTTTRYSTDADIAARKWREGHKHAESVGICGNRPKVAGFPEHLPTPHCVLKAGHFGMHGDGDGAHWTEVAQTSPETTPGATNAPSRVSPVIEGGESA